jgi:hypothetical protein
MKNNFNMGRSFYWQLPREVRNRIVDRFSAGAASYNHSVFYNGKQMRRHLRTAGFRNISDFKDYMINGRYE